MTVEQRFNGELPSTGTIRWRVLDTDLNDTGTEVHPRRPGATITVDVTRKIKRTARGFWLDNTEAATVDEFAGRLGPVWEVDGESFPLGVFLYGDVNRLRLWGVDADDHELESTLVDQCVILDQKLQAGLSFPAGTNLTNMALAVFDLYGIADPLVDTTGLTCSEPMSWAVGRDTGLDALTDIAALAAWWEPYFDNDGRAVMRAAVDPSAAQADYSYGRDSKAVRRRSIIESTDVMGAANVFLALNAGSSATPIVGRYEVPGDQPQSIANRGYAVVETVDAQGIADVPAANAAAQAAGQAAFGEFQPVGFDTIPDPRHDTYDIVAYPDEDTLNLEVSWTLECTPGGDMAHQLRRLYVPEA